MIEPELLVDLHKIVERVHIAMGTEDGRPGQFKAEVAAILDKNKSDLDLDLVFRAVLHTASGANPQALNAL